MTSYTPLQFMGIILLATLPVAECNDGTPLLSVGGVLVMIVFTCCLCMCYRRMYEQRIAMAEAAHAPRAVIITCQSRRPPGAPTTVASPTHMSYPGGGHLPYSPSPHFNPYAPRPADGVPYSGYDSSSTNYIPPAQTLAPTPLPPPPSYDSLFPAQNIQTIPGNQPRGNDAGEMHK